MKKIRHLKSGSVFVVFAVLIFLFVLFMQAQPVRGLECKKCLELNDPETCSELCESNPPAENCVELIEQTEREGGCSPPDLMPLNDARTIPVDFLTCPSGKTCVFCKGNTAWLTMNSSNASFSGFCGPKEICNGIDDNNGYGICSDGVTPCLNNSYCKGGECISVDEGCDDDNDDYCDAGMERASPYQCIDTESKNCCNRGGGDCDDNDADVTGNPPEELCGDGKDNDCDSKTDCYDEDCKLKRECDSDQDRVMNPQDDCPSTPKGNPVNESGCSFPPRGWSLEGNDDRFRIIRIDSENKCRGSPPCLELNQTFWGILSQEIRLPEGKYVLSGVIYNENGNVTVVSPNNDVLASIAYSQDSNLQTYEFEVASETTAKVVITLQGDPQQTDSPVVFDNVSVAALSPSSNPLPSHTYIDYSETGCCPKEYCWNGTGCVDSENFKDSQTFYVFAEDEARGSEFKEGYRCVFDGTRARWVLSRKKWSWDREESGFCAKESECFVSEKPKSSGMKQKCEGEECYVNALRPLESDEYCISNQSFIDNHLCNNGEWTTRTAMIGALLVKLAKKEGAEDYTLHCDDKDFALNEPNDGTGFCVITYNAQGEGEERVVVGAPLNFNVSTPQQVESQIYDLLLRWKYKFREKLPDEEWRNIVTELEKINCEGAFGNKENKYAKCEVPGVNSAAPVLWYNNVTKTVVFSKQGVDLVQIQGGEGFFGWFEKFIKRPFMAVLFWIRSLSPTPEVDIGDFSKMYLAKRGSRNVSGSAGELANGFFVVYSNFSSDICTYAFKYREKSSPVSSMLCSYSADTGIIKTSVASSEEKLITAWPYLTAALRIHDNRSCADSSECEPGKVCCGRQCINIADYEPSKC